MGKETRVRIGNLLILNAVLAVVFALGFLLVPATMADIYGVALTPATLFLARIFGAEVLGVGLICWSCRNLSGRQLPRGITLALLVVHALGAVILLMATLAGVLNSAGWSAVVIYLVLAIGYAYFLFPRPRSA
jgi:hypothetical protein